MKILIVDDETKIREVVSEYAKASNYECDQASNGRQAGSTLVSEMKERSPVKI